MSSLSITLEMADFVNAWDTVRSLTLDPIKDIASYFFPWIGTFFSGDTPICRDDCSSLHWFSSRDINNIYTEVESLSNAAGFTRKVQLYFSTGFSPRSYGGSWSLFSPTIVLPEFYLRRPDHTVFTEKSTNPADPYVFEQNETQFLIAREIAKLKSEGSFLVIATKVFWVAFIILAPSYSFGWLGTTSAMIALCALYLAMNRRYEGSLDTRAVEILTERTKNKADSFHAAQGALHKLQEQNLMRKKRNFFSSLYITRSGNNLLDLKFPLLTSRIEQIEKQSKL